MDHKEHGRGRDAALDRRTRRRRDAVLPGLGPRAPRSDDEDPPRLVRFAPAQLGRADPFFLHKETGALHPRTPELIEEVALRVEKAGIEAWFSLDPKELLGDEAPSTAR
jgi:hypothetical protein